MLVEVSADREDFPGYGMAMLNLSVALANTPGREHDARETAVHAYQFWNGRDKQLSGRALEIFEGRPRGG
jgi:hypothetical protein